MTKVTLQILVLFATCCYLTTASTRYSKEDLASVRGLPSDLTVDWHTGNIFFTLISTDSQMSLHVLKKNQNAAQKIQLEGSGQCSAVDNTNHVVYLATDSGIYVYKEDGPSQPFAASGEDVMYLAVSNDGDTIYYTTWPEKIVLKIKKDGRMPETIDRVAKGQSLTVDLNENLYYVDDDTAYVLLKGERKASKLVGYRFNRQFNFYLQKSGDVFICDEDGNLFKINLPNKRIIEIGNIGLEDVNAFAFDKDDNIVVGVQDKIVLLKKIG